MAEVMTKEKQTAKEAREAARRGMKRMREGEPMEAAIEVTEMMPPSVYLYATGASILASAILFSVKNRDWALFIGQWAPTFLALGIFANVIKHSEHHLEHPRE